MGGGQSLERGDARFLDIPWKGAIRARKAHTGGNRSASNGWLRAAPASAPTVATRGLSAVPRCERSRSCSKAVSRPGWAAVFLREQVERTDEPFLCHSGGPVRLRSELQVRQRHHRACPRRYDRIRLCGRRPGRPRHSGGTGWKPVPNRRRSTALRVLDARVSLGRGLHGGLWPSFAWTPAGVTASRRPIATTDATQDAPGMNRTCARGLGNRCSIH